jgi:hypothetical protein
MLLSCGRFGGRECQFEPSECVLGSDDDLRHLECGGYMCRQAYKACLSCGLIELLPSLSSPCLLTPIRNSRSCYVDRLYKDTWVPHQ